MTWRNKPPTQNQLDFIKTICDGLRIEYRVPETRGEATDFIDENKDYFLRSKYDWGDERESSPS